MKTVKEVFEIAMALADSLNNSGQAVIGDNLEYQHRTPGIINTLESELARLSNYRITQLYEYDKAGEWQGYELPSDFRTAEWIAIDENGSFYKSVKYNVKNVKEFNEETQENVMNKKIFFKSTRVGTIRMDYIPNPPFKKSLDDAISLDDDIATNVLPYGLVALLFLDENPTLASFCQQKYEENKKDIVTSPLPNVLEDVEEPYADSYEGY